MVPIEITYTGDLKCHAVHEPSGVSMTTAAPKDNQGDGSSFSPTDLLATALGTCMMTVMGIAAIKHKIDLKGTRIRVEKHMSTEPPRRVATLAVTIDIPGKIPEELRARLQSAAMTCPVHRTLSHDTDIPVVFNWLD